MKDNCPFSIWIGNLPKDASDMDLISYFGVNNVKEVVFQRQDTSLYGFVHFYNGEQVQAALKLGRIGFDLHGRLLMYI
jgi:RNA recognition motif-containing protein